MPSIRFRNPTNNWPGFVDLFSNLVIILIFLMIVFVFLWTTTSVFNKKTGQKTISELKQQNADQAETIQQMTEDEQQAKRLLIQASAELTNLESDKAELSNEIEEMNLSVQDLVTAYEGRVTDMQNNLAELSKQIAESNENNAALRRQYADISEQLGKLQAALDAAEEKAKEQEAEYVEMSARLNKALADKVAELNDAAQYQSEFYKAIKNALGPDSVLQADGDRFIVSSDILFTSGSYKISQAGRQQLKLIADVIKDLEGKIPDDVSWIIRVDGHTDNRPVLPGTAAFKNNMELSLLRATAVVDALAANGVAKNRLVPSGFGDTHPVATGRDRESLSKNRRIELQLTNR